MGLDHGSALPGDHSVFPGSLSSSLIKLSKSCFILVGGFRGGGCSRELGGSKATLSAIKQNIAGSIGGVGFFLLGGGKGGAVREVTMMMMMMTG